MDRKRRTEYLSKVPLFRGLSQRQLAAIDRVADEMDAPAGEELARQDELGREMFVIVAGSAKVVRNGRKVAELGPGDVFGEMALADSRPRSASVVTTSTSTLLVVPAKAFKPLITSVPRLAEALLASMSGRLREADKRLYG